MCKEIKGKRRKDFIKNEAARSGVSVEFFERMMESSNQTVVECGCGHPCCNNRDGLILETKRGEDCAGN